MLDAFLVRRCRRLLIVKARRMWVSACATLMGVDMAGEIPNLTGAIINKNKELGKKVMEDLLQYTVLHSPSFQALKRVEQYKSGMDMRGKLALTTSTVRLPNNSMIQVFGKPRSVTVQFLLLTEAGPLGYERPNLLKEILDAALPAAQHGLIICESTAMGSSGAYYDMCMVAKERQEKGYPPTRKDWELLFFPWWLKETNVDRKMPRDWFEPEVLDYFAMLAGGKDKIILSEEARSWYQTTLNNDCGGDIWRMRREHPSTLSEAFSSDLAAYFMAKGMSRMEERHGIGGFPYMPERAVYAAWDFGWNDATSVILFQMDGDGMWRILDCFVGRREGLDFYATQLRRTEIPITRHIVPHDAGSKNLTAQHMTANSQESIMGAMTRMHMTPLSMMPKLNDKRLGFEASKRMIRRCQINKDRCGALIEGLRGVHRKATSDGQLSYETHKDKDGYRDIYDAFETACRFLEERDRAGDTTALELMQGRSTMSNRAKIPSRFPQLAGEPANA